MDNINIPLVFHQYSINIPLVVTQDYGLLSHSPFLQKPTVVPFRPVARLPSGARHTWRSSRSRQQTMRPQGPQRRQPTTPRILGTNRDGGKAEAKIWVNPDNPREIPWNQHLNLDGVSPSWISICWFCWEKFMVSPESPRFFMGKSMVNPCRM